MLITLRPVPPTSFKVPDLHFLRTFPLALAFALRNHTLGRPKD